MVRASEQTILLGVLVFSGLWLSRYLRRKGYLRQPVHKAGKQADSTSAQHASSVDSQGDEQQHDPLNGNESLFDRKENMLLQQLRELDQGHLFASWPPPGQADDKKQQLMQQLVHLDASYNGGLAAYIRNAKQLLQDSREGKNPFEGYVPEVPNGERMDFGSASFVEHERQGVKAAAQAAFVLVAGGLGERLGYSGIKLALPVESASGKCFLQVYVESILALQKKACEDQGKPVELELVIMTSDDTHSRTQDLLDDHGFFGMQRHQLHLLKQEKVACLIDNDAHLAVEKDDPYVIQRKPHGHGDVHSLLHSTGLVKKWQGNGVKWVCFFQDTNGLVFRALPAALGVSSKYDFDVNSLAVPRKAKEAIGGIARLRHADGRCMTINVEYNQLDPLLRATGNGQGDVNNEDGWSSYPGNINQLILKVDSYAQSLEETQGIIAEFVNPKYTDASKTAFKSSTRLECMMQDYPKALPSSAAVGFTLVNQVWSTYSPVKNNPADALAKVEAGGPSHSATSGELDIYQVNCRALQMLGAQVDGPQQATFNDLHLDFYPRVVWSPFFAITTDDLKAKFPSPARIHLHRNAMLYIDHFDVQVQSLDLDGALVVEAQPGASVTIDGLQVHNRGWEWQPLKEGNSAAEHEKIRGFTVAAYETEQVKFSEPGNYTLPSKTVLEGEQGSSGDYEEEADASSCQAESKLEHDASRSQQDRQEGNHTVWTSSSEPSPNDYSSEKHGTSDSAVVHSLLHDIMTKAAAEAKGVATETKEAEKLAASSAKSPKPKDEVALKKGDTGTPKGTEETPGHVVPAEAGDKHARTEETQATGSPKKGSKKAKTDIAEATKDLKAEKADNGAAKGVDSAQGDALKPSSPKKAAASASKEAQPSSPVKAAPSSPKKAAASSPKKQAAESADKK
ncbi:hypothetical protein ABBQ38_005262 [Trebouxia sp. C0009 RCD-2024]